MKNSKKLFILVTAVVLAVAMCVVFSGCGNKNGGETDPQDNNPQNTAPAGNMVDHTVTVKSAGGMALEGVAVSVFTDEAMTNLQGYSQTDAG